jgi:hypothetical protein
MTNATITIKTSTFSLTITRACDQNPYIVLPEIKKLVAPIIGLTANSQMAHLVNGLTSNWDEEDIQIGGSTDTDPWIDYIYTIHLTDFAAPVISHKKGQ